MLPVKVPLHGSRQSPKLLKFFMDVAQLEITPEKQPVKQISNLVVYNTTRTRTPETLNHHLRTPTWPFSNLSALSTIG